MPSHLNLLYYVKQKGNKWSEGSFMSKIIIKRTKNNVPDILIELKLKLEPIKQELSWIMQKLHN